MKKVFFVCVIIVFCLCVLYFLQQDKQETKELKSEKEKIIKYHKVDNIPDRICDIRNYGARSGIDFKSTIAINAAIDDCAKQGGGNIFVPEGKWFTGSIKLQSNINLFVADGAEIIFSTDLQDYLPIVFTRFQGIEFYNYSPLIYVKDSHNIAITGKGKLIGNGDNREDWTGGGNFATARRHLYQMSREGVSVDERIFGDKEPGLRPSFVQFVNCTDILLDGFTIENGPIWTIHPVYSDNFVVRNLTINTWSGNTDGIVIDSTTNVLIENSNFSTGDDAISIKSGLDEDGWRVNKPSEHIDIHNISVTKGSSGVSIGSEMSGGVSDVNIQDSVFANTRHGFRIKTTKSRGGYVRDVEVKNIEMNNITGDAIDFNFAYSSELQSKDSHKPPITNILIKNIFGQNSERLVINMDGIARSVMENINIEDVHFTSSERSVSLKMVHDIFLQNINIDSKDNPTYEFENSQNIQLKNSKCHNDANPCIEIIGAKSKNISIENVDFSLAKEKMKFSEDADLQTIQYIK
jgi:polygalacturonase